MPINLISKSFQSQYYPTINIAYFFVLVMFFLRKYCWFFTSGAWRSKMIAQFQCKINQSIYIYHMITTLHIFLASCTITCATYHLTINKTTEINTPHCTAAWGWSMTRLKLFSQYRDAQCTQWFHSIQLHVRFTHILECVSRRLIRLT